MTRFAPLWQQNGSYTAQNDRVLLDAIYPAGYGVYKGGTITAVSGTMNVSVAPGTAVIPISAGNPQICKWDAAEVLTLPAADAQDRYDLIIVQIRDAFIDAGSNNDFIVTYVKGVASATPSVPATPANAFAIGNVRVKGGAANLNTSTVVNSGTALVSLYDSPVQIYGGVTVNGMSQFNSSVNIGSALTTNSTATFPGTLTASAAHNYFGASAGGSAPYVDIGSQGDANNAWITAGSGTLSNVALALQSKGSGSILLRDGAGNNVIQVDNPGGANNRWTAGVVSIGYGAAGAANSYISMGSESTTQVNITAQGYSGDVNLRLAIKGLGQFYFTDNASAIKVNIKNDGSIYSVGTASAFGAGALGADNSYIAIGQYDPDNALIACGNGNRGTTNMIFQTKGNGAFTLRIGSDLNKQLQLDANGDLWLRNGPGTWAFAWGHDGTMNWPLSQWSGSASDGGVGVILPPSPRGFITVAVSGVGVVKIPVYLT